MRAVRMVARKMRGEGGASKPKVTWETVQIIMYIRARESHAGGRGWGRVGVRAQGFIIPRPYVRRILYI